MKKKLVIVGAGGLGRIVYDVLCSDQVVLENYFLAGFLDTRHPSDLPSDLPGHVLGNPLDYHPNCDEVFISAVGDPLLRQKLLAPLIAKNAQFYSYTHRSSVASRTQIGQGVFLTPGSVLSTDCSIGDHTYIDTLVVIGHDTHIGANCMIGAMSFIAGNVIVHDEVAIHPRSTIAKEIILEKGCTIGIGSVVIKNVSSKSTVFGNPARNIFAS